MAKTTKKKAKKKASKKTTKKVIKKVKKKQYKIPRINPTGMKIHSTENDVQYIEERAKKNTGKVWSEGIPELVIDMMSAGAREAELRNQIGIGKDQYAEWKSQHPAFRHALSVGRANFLEKLPSKLIKHMEQGYSFQSFGAVISRSRAYLYRLREAYKDFARAVEEGQLRSMYWHERLAQRISAGQITVEMGERPAIAYGKLVKDDDGNPVMYKLKNQARTDSGMHRFMMSNLFREYKGLNDEEKDEMDKDLKDAFDELQRREESRIGK